MNRHVWVASMVAILAPMMITAAQKSTFSDLDIVEINREAAAQVAHLNASSPTAQVNIENLGQLCDLVATLSKQDPTSPKLTATKKAIKALTRRASSSSPKFEPLPAPAIATH